VRWGVRRVRNDTAAKRKAALILGPQEGKGSPRLTKPHRERGGKMERNCLTGRRETVGQEKDASWGIEEKFERKEGFAASRSTSILSGITKVRQIRASKGIGSKKTREKEAHGWRAESLIMVKGGGVRGKKKKHWSSSKTGARYTKHKSSTGREKNRGQCIEEGSKNGSRIRPEDAMGEPYSKSKRQFTSNTQ